MNAIGRIFLVIAQLTWGIAIVGNWFVNNKIDSIYLMCIAIGLMLISSHIIDYAKGKGWKAPTAMRWCLEPESPAEFNSARGSYFFWIWNHLNFHKIFYYECIRFAHARISLRERRTWNCHSCGSAAFPWFSRGGFLAAAGGEMRCAP